MTVKELIKKLSEYSDETDVWLYDLNSGFGFEIKDINKHPEEDLIVINGE